MIIRSYGCEDCGLEFEVTCDSGDDGDPDCPRCTKVLQWIPKEFAIKTNKSRAIDYTQDVLEKDYGLSNLNDNAREGDVAYKPPSPPHAGEREAVEREVREYVAQTTTPVPQPTADEMRARAIPQTANFWGAQPTGGVQTQPVAAQTALAGLKYGPQYPDRNPMKLLQEGIKSGQLTNKVRIIAKWNP